MAQSKQSDERLVEEASAGDRRAFAEIFDRYQRDLSRYCAALLGNSEDAGDALQNTMVKVLRALPGESRRIDLKPWLYRIAHNESIELVRKRRDMDSIDTAALLDGHDPEADAETRERLRQLIVDLRALPERQRGSLVMRELGGLSFEEIGSAFETSAAVARQTVYEARIGLQEMEKGRAMECDEVRRKLSDGDRRVFRRRDVRAHLRHCSGCREFEAGISRRRDDLASIAPIPAVIGAGLLKGALGSAAGSAGSSAAGGGALGGTISASVAVKAVATVAAAGAIGVGAADRAGVVHVFGAGDSPSPAARSANRPTAPAAATEGAPKARAADPRDGEGAPSGRSAARAASVAGPPKAGKETEASAADGSAQGTASRGSGHRSSSSVHPQPAKGQGKAGGRGGSANSHGGNPHASGAHQGKAAGHGAGHGSGADPGRSTAHPGAKGGAGHSGGGGKEPAPDPEAPQPKGAGGEPQGPPEPPARAEVPQPSGEGKPEA